MTRTHFITTTNSIPWVACNGRVRACTLVTAAPELVTCGNCRRWLDARPALVAAAKFEREYAL